MRPIRRRGVKVPEVEKTWQLGSLAALKIYLAFGYVYQIGLDRIGSDQIGLVIHFS